ncbi:hypothetical protein TI03_03030 [Achromatium sp. WMS1]|nr:hypothetical protein TI03_03030 [Achromatium sp. WMS1]
MFGATNLGVKSDYQMFFSKENPQLMAFKALQRVYTKDDNILFVLTPKDGKVFTNRTLSAVKWLTTEGWQVPYSTRVDSITNFQYTKAEGDDLAVNDLVEDPTTLTPQQLQAVQTIAVNEPLLVHRLIDPQAQVTGVNITVP